MRVEPAELFFDDPEEVFFGLRVAPVDRARLFCELPERLLVVVRDFEPAERACPERAELPRDLVSERASF